MRMWRVPAAGAPGSLEYRPWLWLQILSCSALLGLTLGIVLVNVIGRGYLSGKEYHLWRWQADTFLDVAFERIGIGPGATPTDEKSLLEYFRLTSQIRAELDAAFPDVALVDALSNERATYENDTERQMEAWIDEAIVKEGLRRELPLFNGVEFTWPPVAFELTSPPRLLVRSPRDRIERAGDTLLKNDLGLEDVQEIEAKTDDEDTVSIVVSIGGLAAYPAIVRDDRTYESMLETAAHEWVHHYLAFFPLGERFGKGRDGTTLNETTADLAGREIARLVRDSHPVEFPANENGAAPRNEAPKVDFNAEMRKLRLEVDALLEEGKIAEAEETMEMRREYLAENGIIIRKLNQAYFAFYGSYAGSAQSTDPIGPKVDRVFELTGNVGTFLSVMREVESEGELDELIAQLEALQTP